MNWQTDNLATEWRRFRQHCDFTFNGPLATKTEGQKVNYLMTYIGDKGREIYETFVWTPATDDTPAENATLEGVCAKYAQYVAPMKNHIRATVSFNHRKQDAGEKFDNFVTELRILVKDCGDVRHGHWYRPKLRDITGKHARYRHRRRSDSSCCERSQIEHTSTFVQQASVPVQAARLQDTGNKCMKCGYDRNHARCPAKDSNCNYCRKKGHFAVMRPHGGGNVWL